jgi:hypothetical protein
MPGKRISFAAGLKAQGPMRKVGRAGGSNAPLVVCARRWGGAHWVFEGRVGKRVVVYMPQLDTEEEEEDAIVRVFFYIQKYKGIDLYIYINVYNVYIIYIDDHFHPDRVLPALFDCGTDQELTHLHHCGKYSCAVTIREPLPSES